MAEEISFGEMLRLERKRLGWRQEDLADKIGDKAFCNNDSGDPVTRQTIIRWERGSHFPFPHNLKNLVAVLGLDQKGADAFYRAAVQAPSIPEQPIDEQQIIDNLPFQRNPFFTGREEHLERLGNLLQVNGTAAIKQPISISGLGGIGKTQLALEYAHRHYPKVYSVALWVNAPDEDTLQASYASLAQTLELEEQNEHELDKRIRAVNRWLKTHTNWLLVMDNADDLQLARSFLPSVPLGHVIFTTRSQIVRDSNIAAQINVEEMESEEGLLFLLRRSGIDATPDIRETALQLVKLLGGHPLALDQAGAYINGAKVSFTDYLKRYHKQRRLLLGKRRLLENKSSEHREDIQHPESVVATIELSFQMAHELHPLAADILHFCAFLHPDEIPEEIFQHDDGFKPDTVEFDEAIVALHCYSLIKRNIQEKTYSLHRLVQAVITDRMVPDLQRQWRERVALALNGAFPDEPVLNDWQRCERLLPHVLICAAWTEDELTPTAASGKMFYRTSTYLRGQMKFAEAELLLTRVISIFTQHFGTESLNTAKLQYALAQIYMLQGKHRQADPLLRLAVPILERYVGADDPVTADILNTAALYCSHEGKFEQAEQFMERAIAIMEARFGTERPETALMLCNLAGIYNSQEKLNQAEALYQRVLAIYEKYLGAEHPDVARVQCLLGNICIKIGDLEQAEVRYQQALSIWEKCLVADHPFITLPLLMLSVLLHLRGEYEQAEILHQRGMDITKQNPEELCTDIASLESLLDDIPHDRDEFYTKIAGLEPANEEAE